LQKFGEALFDFIVSLIKPYSPTVWELIKRVLAFNININLVGIFIFVILLFPIYRFIDKKLIKRFGNRIIFRDKFDEGNKGWLLNYWGSTNPDKTNRIENSAIVFEASPEELLDSRKEFGAYFDLRNGVYQGNVYEVTCKVRAIQNTTMQFRLWLHDTRGGSDSTVVTEFITPQKAPQTIRLKYTANQNEAIRIHLHNKAGSGRIIVEEVLVKIIDGTSPNTG
jgi:hypothetical protein